jgi:hypothetical protein
VFLSWHYGAQLLVGDGRSFAFLPLSGSLKHIGRCSMAPLDNNTISFRFTLQLDLADQLLDPPAPSFRSSFTWTQHLAVHSSTTEVEKRHYAQSKAAGETLQVAHCY